MFSKFTIPSDAAPEIEVSKDCKEVFKDEEIPVDGAVTNPTTVPGGVKFPPTTVNDCTISSPPNPNERLINGAPRKKQAKT
jgi:hypothetical protein